MEQTDRWDTWFLRAVRLTSYVVGMGLVIYEALAGHDLMFAVLGVGISGITLPYWIARVVKEAR